MFNLLTSKKEKTGLSLPKIKLIRGYEIKKLPIGGYLVALEKIQSLPGDFLNKCYPGESLDGILNKLTGIDEKGLVDIATNIFIAAPSYIVAFVADLTGIPEDRLLNDENIGLDGFAEIVSAFLEVNEMGKFIGAAGEIKEKIMKMIVTQTPVTGSND